MTIEELRKKLFTPPPADAPPGTLYRQAGQQMWAGSQLLAPLLAVAEAAEKVAKAERDDAEGRIPPPGRDHRLRNLEAALREFDNAREGV